MAFPWPNQIPWLLQTFSLTYHIPWFFHDRGSPYLSNYWNFTKGFLPVSMFRFMFAIAWNRSSAHVLVYLVNPLSPRSLKLPVAETCLRYWHIISVNVIRQWAANWWTANQPCEAADWIANSLIPCQIKAPMNADECRMTYWLLQRLYGRQRRRYHLEPGDYRSETTV